MAAPSSLSSSAFSTMRAIVLAEHNAHKGAMTSSALLCVEDARKQYRAGNLTAARRFALRSLAYSVGTFSEVYREAAEA